MEWLKNKKLDELVTISPDQMRTMIGSMVGATPANNINQIGGNLPKKDAGLAVAIASDPGTEKAKAILDAQKKKNQPNQQQNTNLGPNVIGAMPGTQI